MIPNIVHTLGGGSGIDTQELVNQLVELESAPSTLRLDTRQELLETQISDFGFFRSAMSELESAVEALGNEDTFNAKSISVPNTSLISLTALNPSAVAGTHKIQIDQVAQSHTLSSGATTYASTDAQVGTGTLTLRFGSWDAGETTFTVDPDKTGAEIVIDETNNSLEGLRDAINSADIDVQASIVDNGSGEFQLLLTGPSGASNEIEIVATEEVSNPGLANFDFNETTQNLNQEQEGLDAELRLNGLSLSRASNTITDVIEGLEFDVFNASASEVINLTITEDKNFAETAIRDFVDAYNLFLENVEVLVDFNPEINDFGSLKNDSLANSLISSVRNYLGTTVTGIDDGFTILANIGIRTQLDGTLDIVDDENQINTSFRAAIDDNFDLVRSFFVPQTSSDDSRLKINGYGSRTESGSYDIDITAAATQGTLTFTDPVTSFDTTGNDYSFDIEIDGVTATINLPDATTYADEDDLASEIQSLINLDQNFVNAGVSVAVSYDGGFQFVSNNYGSDSNVSITAIGADTAEIGLSVLDGTAGSDIVGTVDGVEGFGFGNVLLPKIGSAAEGLKMIITPGETFQTNVNFSRGFGGGLLGLFDTFLSNNGLISEHEEGIEKKLDDVEDDRVALERRTEAYRARLESQFIAMEAIVRSLNNTGTFFDGIADRLPFTAQ